MKTYFSTFITGFKEVVEQALKERVKDVQIELLSDGLVIYRSHKTPDAIRQLRFFNNSFLLLKYFPRLGKKPIEEMLKQTVSDRQIVPAIDNLLPKIKSTFRIMATQENQFVPIDKNLKTRLESMIGQKGKLRLDRGLPGIEFLFAARREGNGLFGLRLTRHTSYEKILEKGELYPELAHILCLISEPNQNDTFLDPFCGSGAIPIARAIGFPYGTIYASDIENKSVEKTRQKASKANRKIIIRKCDALHLDTFNDNSIDKIVTDPPWGLHVGKELNLEKFYQEMLTEFQRIDKQNGIMVILIAKKELFEDVLNKFSSRLKVIKQFDTLVSGQKARVYKIQSF